MPGYGRPGDVVDLENLPFFINRAEDAERASLWRSAASRSFCSARMVTSARRPAPGGKLALADLARELGGLESTTPGVACGTSGSRLQHVGKLLPPWPRLIEKGGDNMARIRRTFLIGFNDDVRVPWLAQRGFEMCPASVPS